MFKSLFRPKPQSRGPSSTDGRVVYAVGDIHGRLDLLDGLIDRMTEDYRGLGRQDPPVLVMLGDYVDRGAQSSAVIDRLIALKGQAAEGRFEFRALMGNHDFAVLFEPFNFNPGAEQACFWTRQQFETDPDPKRRAERWKFIGNLPVRIRTNEFVATHASPRRPINEYIFPDDIYTNPGKFHSIFEKFDRLCFVGHTHVPGVFLEGPDFYSPDELEYRFEFSDEKAIINVGSVGQPRDKDPRASFVIVNDNVIEFVRLEYDVETTVRKVHAIAELDNFLGDRLLDGR